jgi:hypothetical protein
MTQIIKQNQANNGFKKIRIISILLLFFVSSCSTHKRTIVSPPSNNSNITICTQLGCHNSITILLPKDINLKPGQHTISIRINAEKFNEYTFEIVNINNSSCIKERNILIGRVNFISFETDAYSCDTSQTYKIKKIGKLKTFTLYGIRSTIEKSGKITIKIKDSSNKLLLNQKHKIKFDKTNPFYPNGVKCGGACYRAYLQLK